MPATTLLAPLPERLRPRNLSEYVGQKHLVGEGCILRNMIESGNLSSFILWGPPGVGKTTLARIIAETLGREFYTLSAVSSGVKEVREVFEQAKTSSLFRSGKAPILFIDEIHRFSKAQQDALLGAVEQGVVVLIGATTENPSFEVISPLLSRCQVYVLKSLEKEDLLTLLNRALTEDDVLKEKNIVVKETDALLRQSGGDGRKLLNILEVVVDSFAGKKEIVIDNKVVNDCLQKSTAIYDKDGEMHYDIISAFIKSVRGSDPNAAVYYLARIHRPPPLHPRRGGHWPGESQRPASCEQHFPDSPCHRHAGSAYSALRMRHLPRFIAQEQFSLYGHQRGLGSRCGRQDGPCASAPA